MRKFLTWLTIGVVAFVAYTYGAKAGRARYREIKATLDAVWNDPRVKKARKRASKQADKVAKSATKQAKKIGRKL
ncbi:hypothetical protein [Homoserinimonas sp. OAct 916]|uniref:hypothetical protein n=1 Tax=Homoserinimonas sp. OAct 916 TaxID=2211450 RepID=UPI000DBE8865|nr:hypothetical protein [Homoserinimonas sp. OAct 916]